MPKLVWHIFKFRINLTKPRWTIVNLRKQHVKTSIKYGATIVLENDFKKIIAKYGIVNMFKVVVVKLWPIYDSVIILGP